MVSLIPINMTDKQKKSQEIDVAQSAVSGSWNFFEKNQKICS